jgi:chemotaxis protein MotB
MDYFREAAEEFDERQNSNLWLIIYTDMISNLMIFFLMLYGLTLLGKEDRTVAAASFEQAFSGNTEAVIEVEKGISKKKNAVEELRKDFVNVEVNEDRIRIILPSPVLFDSGSADLKSTLDNSLRDIGDAIKKMPDRKVIVEGHTDNIPIHTAQYTSNRELSSSRAFSVIKYLVDHEGVPPRQISALGYGEYRPIAPNNTPRNRAKNRRIEINIIKPK